MTIYTIAVHHITHTCPADPQPHPIDTTRRILVVADGGPCRNPITIRLGDTVTTVACGRHEPADRQCPACRTIVIEHTVTTEHLGHQDRAEPGHQPGQPPAATGYAAQPCTVCRQPLAAVLADTRRHILCTPARPTRAAA